MDISPGEISRVIQLVREVCDRWDDPNVWREHLLRGACTLLDGNVGTIFEVDAPTVPGKYGAIRPVAILGLPAIKAELVHTAATTVSHQEPEEISNSFIPGHAKLVAEFKK